MSWEKELNDSELVQLARIVNPHVHRGLPREILFRILDDEDVDLNRRRVDIARRNIFTMVDRHWGQVKSLISCPMRTRTVRACFGCTDIQVAECTLLNEKLIDRAKQEDRNG